MSDHRAARRTADGGYTCTHCGRRWDADDTPPPCEPTEPTKAQRPWTRNQWREAKTKNPITPKMWKDLKDSLNGKKNA